MGAALAAGCANLARGFRILRHVGGWKTVGSPSMSGTTVSNNRDSQGFPKTALSLLIAGCLGFVALSVFEPAIHRYDILDLESAAWACFAVIAIGTLLGLCSLRTPMGKLVALIGIVILVGLSAWVSYSGGPAATIEPMEMQREVKAPNNAQPQIVAALTSRDRDLVYVALETLSGEGVSVPEQIDINGPFAKAQPALTELVDEISNLDDQRLESLDLAYAVRLSIHSPIWPDTCWD